MFTGLFAASVIAIAAGFLMYWKHPVITQSEQLKNPVQLSIVIPARNEEQNLSNLLESIKKQTVQPHEIIVADDGSTDRTVEVAKCYGTNVMTVRKEADWKGKTAGCFQGAKAATGDWLLFMDADTWFADSKALERIASAYRKQGSKGMLSIQPYHAIQKGYENFSVIFNVLAVVGMNVFSVLGSKVEEAGGFGPFMLCTKENYTQTGGHQAAKGSLIEGFALGKHFKEKQLPIHLFEGEGVVHFRMYSEGIADLMDGWTKHFATGSKDTHPVVMLIIICWVAGGFLAPAFFILTLVEQTFIWMLIGFFCYIAYFLQLYLFARRTGSFSIWMALIYPVLFFFFAGVFTRSWLATNVFRSVQWKGQKIDL